MRARIGIGMCAALLAVSLAGCANGSLDSRAGAGVSLTIGSTDTFADQVVAQIYGQALAADGFSIDYNTGIRDDAGQLEALKAGRIDVVPVDLGEMLAAVAPGVDPGDTSSSTSSLQRVMTPAGISVLTPSEAEDTVVFVTTKKFASSNSLNELDDLRALTMPLTFADLTSIEDLAYGRTPLQNAYGIQNWTELVTGTADGALAALRSGRAQVAVIPTVSAQLYASTDLTVLADPRLLVPPQNVTPIIRTAAATQEVGRVLDAVSSKLRSRDLADFAGRSDALASTVAHAWLQRTHLLPTTG